MLVGGIGAQRALRQPMRLVDAPGVDQRHHQRVHAAQRLRMRLEQFRQSLRWAARRERAVSHKRGGQQALGCLQGRSADLRAPVAPPSAGAACAASAASSGRTGRRFPDSRAAGRSTAVRRRRTRRVRSAATPAAVAPARDAGDLTSTWRTVVFGRVVDVGEPIDLRAVKQQVRILREVMQAFLEHAARIVEPAALDEVERLLGVGRRRSWVWSFTASMMT